MWPVDKEMFNDHPKFATIIESTIVNKVEEFCINSSLVNNGLGTVTQGGSNMTGTDFYVNKPHCAAAVRP